MVSSQCLVNCVNISKHFGGTLALVDVSFEVQKGELHALMGENGAGKSTLMNVLAGAFPPDAGKIYIEGTPVRFGSPKDAASAGIAVIHQELNTFPNMTVAENLAMDMLPTRFGMIDRKKMANDAREKLSRVDADIDPSDEIGQLSVGRQQLVEIAKAVSMDAKALVLDEPTSALSRAESEQLFRIIRSMRANGMGLIYISHRMEEVWSLANRITVLRDGHLIATRYSEEITPDDAVRMMVGRSIERLYVRSEHQPRHVGLEAQDLSDGGSIGPISFALHHGEVVGLAGLIGAGRTEVGRMLFGADRARTGTISVEGQLRSLRNTLDAIRAGIGMVPEDRKRQALFLHQDVEANISVSSLQSSSTASFLRLKLISGIVKTQMERLSIRLNAMNTAIRDLSGGNQQKAVLGRWLLRDTDILVLDEPTRGVDIGSKNEIYRLIDELAKDGKVILLISSDLAEVVGVSDRILVMREGQMVADLNAHWSTEEEVMSWATGLANAARGGENE